MEDHVQMLTDGLSRRKLEVTIITTSHQSGKEYEKRGNVEIFYLKNSTPRRYSKRWWAATVKKFEELHKLKNFDVVHSQGAGGLYFFKQSINEKYNIPGVVSLHGTAYDEFKSQINLLRAPKSLHRHDVIKTVSAPIRIMKYRFRDYPFIDKPIMQHADGVIATSNEQREMMLTHVYSLPSSKIFTVFNGIDTDIFRPYKDNKIRKKLKIGKNEALLVCIAVLKKEKGIQNIIKALPAILKEYGRPLKLIIVSDGEYRKTLEELVEKKGLKGNVMFTGFVDDDELIHFFSAGDVFINATIRQSGYELTIPEAMSCERPLVVSNIGSVPTIVKDGEDGLLVPPGDVDAIAKAVVKLLSNKDLRKKLGKNARKKVVKSFSVESMTEGVLNVYKTVIEKRRRKSKG